jgi:hypothetical protein
MATLDQVITQLRFGLEQLSSKNAHHEFEHLCRRYARARVCSNILPATGPVSAGGDQARDFETFRTYLANSPIAANAFVGHLSEGPLAFACTIQKDSLASKIQADITTILTSGTQVVAIHYFCAADLPVGKRHDLQKWAREENNVELEIHDGQAIAENLAEPDTFWIAVEYLHVPSDMFPRNSHLVDDGYVEVHDKWKSLPVDPESYSDLEEIKQLLRHTSTDDRTRADLPFWIVKAFEFKVDDAPPPIRRRAQYEIAVARLKGFGTLCDFEQDIIDYFQDVQSIGSLDELDDCVLLLSFSLSAQAMGQAAFPLERLAEWHDALVEHVEAELAREHFPSWVAFLLQMRGTLSVHSISASGIGFDFDDQFRYWKELSDILPEARLFPVEKFADALSGICEFAGEDPRFSEITEKVDAVLAERVGCFAVAGKCRDRAMAHYRQGRILMAVSEIHKAKVHWFAEETLDGCILALHLLAQWYSEIGLAFAGKYHALAANYIAIRQSRVATKARAWKATFEAALCDYRMGAFAGFVDLTILASAMHYRLEPSPGNIDDNPMLESIIFHSAVAVYLSERLSPNYFKVIQNRISSIGIGPPLEGCLEALREEWGKKNDDELRKLVLSQALGMPVSDIEPSRSVSWHALGIEWTIEWTNSYSDNVLAEQFCACLQTIQADLIHEELCLPRTTVEVEFRLDDAEMPRFVPLPADECFRWRLYWPTGPTGSIEDEFAKVVTASLMLLSAASFRKQDEIAEILMALEDFRLNSKALMGHSYYTVYSDLIDQEYFREGRDGAFEQPERPQESKIAPHLDLVPKVCPGPGYSKAIAEESIRERYDVIQKLIPVTLRRLRKQKDFLDVVTYLRGRGWKDWHILSALFTSVMNFRCAQRFGSHPTHQQVLNHMKQFTSEPETRRAKVVPLSVLRQPAGIDLPLIVRCCY